MTDKIVYPYLPEGHTYHYISARNPFIVFAKNYARLHALDKAMPGAAVIVSRKGGDLLGFGANGSNYHETNGCQRVALGSKSGDDYDLCEGCHTKNHSEAKALRHASESGHNPHGAHLYLWGHWFCCKGCWTLMLSAGISRVMLLEGSQILFNKEHPNNIVGRQFSV